jgi:molybdopterin molybdotransferase
MLELEQALAQILATLPAPVSRRIALHEAHGRTLLEPVHTSIDLPPFDYSAMDGFAVRAGDVTAANFNAPVRLRVRGKIAAGETFTGTLAGGQCLRLFTGSPMPPGADAVVIQEDTRVDTATPDDILIIDAVQPRENVRFRGGDVAGGAILAKAGDVLTPARLGLLAAAGVTEVSVGKPPIVGLLATGSELREAGVPLGAGQIYESNRIVLAALLQRAGAIPKIFPIVPDTLAATRTLLERAFNECEAVVTTGGVSVGEMDFVKVAFEKLGGELQFWKVAIRPGKPFVFGRWRDKFLFGVPGNPVSALVTFLLLVRPALSRWQGTHDVDPPAHPGVLTAPLANPGDRRHFMRVCVDSSGMVSSAGLQASHALSSLASANGLIDVPPRKTLAAGTTVRVIRWD